MAISATELSGIIPTASGHPSRSAWAPARLRLPEAGAQHQMEEEPVRKQFKLHG